MKVILVILSYFFICGINSYTLKRIQGIQDELVQKVRFDSDGNVYASTLSINKQRLYKFNSSNELDWTIDLPDNSDAVFEMLVSSRGDIYFNFIDSPTRIAAVLRSGSKIVEEIDQQLYLELFFVDDDGNLFYQKTDGVYIVRPNSSVPIAIRNLENFTAGLLTAGIFDQSGNIYLPVDNRNNSNRSLAVITKDALQEEIPYGDFINVLDSPGQFVDSVVFDETNDLWITIADDTTRETVIKKLANGDLKTIFTDKALQLTKMVPSKGLIYVQGENSVDRSTTVYYITLKDEIVEIPELINMTAEFFLTEGIADSDGYTYFDTFFGEFSPSLGKMIAIKPDEMKPIGIKFPTSDVLIDSVQLDFNEDVWIAEADGIYHLKKGETVLDLVNNPHEICIIYRDVNVNFVTKNIYVSCANGLFIVENS